MSHLVNKIKTMMENKNKFIVIMNVSPSVLTMLYSTGVQLNTLPISVLVSRENFDNSPEKFKTEIPKIGKLMKVTDTTVAMVSLILGCSEITKTVIVVTEEKIKFTDIVTIHPVEVIKPETFFWAAQDLMWEQAGGPSGDDTVASTTTSSEPVLDSGKLAEQYGLTVGPKDVVFPSKMISAEPGKKDRTKYSIQEQILMDQLIAMRKWKTTVYEMSYREGITLQRKNGVKTQVTNVKGFVLELLQQRKLPFAPEVTVAGPVGESHKPGFMARVFFLYNGIEYEVFTPMVSIKTEADQMAYKQVPSMASMLGLGLEDVFIFEEITSNLSF